MKITNTSRALQGIWTDAGLAFLEAGETRDIDVAESYVERVHALPFLTVTEADPLDHDGNGEKGGSLPNAPVGLSGKNKAELIAIATAEGAEIEDTMTVADLKSAIELHRGG